MSRKTCEFKFGDIVINEWASESNPTRCLMFLKKDSKDAFCLTREGKRVSFRIDSEMRLTLAGKISFENWDNAINGGESK